MGAFAIGHGPEGDGVSSNERLAGLGLAPPACGRRTGSGAEETDLRPDGRADGSGSHRDDLAVLLAGASSSELVSAWHSAAALLGRLAGADRASIVSVASAAPRTVGWWANDGAAPTLSVSRLENASGTIDRLRRGEAISLSGRDRSAGSHLDSLLELGAAYIRMLPLFDRGSFVGFVGFEWIAAGDVGPALDRHDELGSDLRALAASLGRCDQAGRDAGTAATDRTTIDVQLLASLEHALRTPLSSVFGITQLLESVSLSQEQREQLQMASSSCRDLVEVIDDAIDLLRTLSHRLQLDSLPFSLREVVYRTLKSIDSTSGSNSGVECQISPDVADNLIGDRTRVARTLTCMLRLALSVRGAEQVTLRVGTETGDPGEAHLHFAIIASGAGLRTSTYAEIFEAQAIEAAFAGASNGASGVSLALCKQLVRLMGGSIWCETEPPGGSVFHFTIRLPIDDARASCSSRSRLPETLRSRPVLVAVGSPSTRDELVELLVSWGMQPALLPGPEALAATLERSAARGERFGLAIVDVPGNAADDPQFCDLLENASVDHDTPLVLLTEAAPGQPSNSWQPGAVQRLARPLTPGELFDAIVLANRRPAEPSHERAGEPAVENEPGLRILLAEDHPINRRLAVRLLERAGHRVTAVENGEQVLDVLGGDRFDVLLMDLQMPVMNGLDAAIAVRSMERTGRGRLPIIALTAHTQPEDRELCLAAGMDAYLAKPFESELLLAAIRDVTARHEAAR
jgi:CheY-like chemotaxis protein